MTTAKGKPVKKESAEPLIPDELPEGWLLTRLKDGIVLSMQPGFACGTHNHDDQGIAHLRPMNVSKEGSINLSNLKFIRSDEANKEERLVSAGDVIFNNTNSPELVGKTAYYSLPESRAFSNHMTRLRCHQDALSPQYCALALHHSWQCGYFLAVCNNHVSQSSISRTVLSDAPIPLPPLAEQKRIVAKGRSTPRRRQQGPKSPRKSPENP